jgi:hypothetical protein
MTHDAPSATTRAAAPPPPRYAYRARRLTAGERASAVGVAAGVGLVALYLTRILLQRRVLPGTLVDRAHSGARGGAGDGRE